MSYQLVPSSNFRYAFKKRFKGSDVAALQINLGVVVDGIYGDETEAAVLEWQNTHDLVVDGIAGVATQQSLVVHISRPIQKEYDLPAGILKSIASNESAFLVASAGPHNSDAGWDVGVYARSSGKTYPGQPFLYSAFSIKESAEWTANNLVETKEEIGVPINSEYLSSIGNGNKDQFAWQLTILSHNWPAAAQNIARRGAATVDYTGDDNTDDVPTQWIIDATNGRLKTPREWVTSYIERATVYVRWSK